MEYGRSSIMQKSYIWCDICGMKYDKDDSGLCSNIYYVNGGLTSKDKTEFFSGIYPDEADICYKCFAKHIVPLLKGQ